MPDLKYFKPSEFIMGDEEVYHLMDTIFLETLDELRYMVCEPIHITSSYRSPAYNKSVNGSKGSFHLKGRAVDIACTDSRSRMVIIREALKLGMTVGVAGAFLHLDDRDYQIVFTY